MSRKHLYIKKQVVAQLPALILRKEIIYSALYKQLIVINPSIVIYYFIVPIIKRINR